MSTILTGIAIGVMVVAALLLAVGLLGVIFVWLLAQIGLVPFVVLLLLIAGGIIGGVIASDDIAWNHT